MKTVGIFMSTEPLIIPDYSLGQRLAYPALPLFSKTAVKEGGPPFHVRLLYICLLWRYTAQ